MRIELDDRQNKSRIAITVVGYNRLRSITRLLNSLRNARYPDNDVPLVISIDCSGDTELYDYVQKVDWPFGDKYVLIRESRLGLKEHIFHCSDLSKHFRAVIILEDDTFVSPGFYSYVCEAVAKYRDDDRVAGIALYRNETNGYVGIPFTPLHNGSDAFALQDACTSGQCFTEKMWSGFREWLKVTEVDFSALDMPEQIRHWKSAWSKWFIAYLLHTDKYFIFPYTAVTTNFGDVGTHGDKVTTTVQVNLLWGQKSYRLLDFDELVKYDVFWNYRGLGKILGVDEKELCVDFYGENTNRMGKRFWLSIAPAPFEIVRSFALHMRPMELNVINSIEGNEIFLYDTTRPVAKRVKRKIDTEYYLFHLNGFRRDFLLASALRHYSDAVKRKLNKLRK